MASQLLRSTFQQTKKLLGCGSYIKHQRVAIRKQWMSQLPKSDASHVPPAFLSAENKWLSLQFDQNQKNYPYVWLRDNCKCSKCYHEVASQRLLQFVDLDIDVEAKSMHVSESGKDIFINWSDGHEGFYPLSFLEGEHFPAFSDPLRQVKQELWGSELQGQIPTFQFSDILTKDKDLFAWLTALHTKGFAVIENAEREVGQIHKVADRVAYLKRTYYGDTFQVTVKLDPNNIAWTGTGIDFHSDLCALYNQPGMQMLHCIKQSSSGGSNILADTFKIIPELQKEEPDVYNTLKNTLFEFTDIGTEFNDFNFRSSKPAFSYDYEGHLRQVSIHFGRHHSMNVPADKVYDVYKALKVFFHYLHKKENMVEYKMSEGDIMCMDNRRLVHGRAEYKVNPSVEGVQRHLEGGYVDWDELNSFYRVLLERFTK
ncbi:gamma-butyrobetaine dioxygenase-like isoform X1 [Antedon mediterranea]|uniref:gamma-butyrobetaine dioxygenase-like isoform X1 n=1 Tax=Antedon mediterranea TaxID=105859 RepID=UPI003AF47AF0